MSVLITGSVGFIGKAVYHHLWDNGIDVIGYDLPEEDLLDLEQLRESVKKVSTVVHLAAVADLNDTMKDMDRTFDVNIRGTYELAKICAEEGVRLIFGSTCCAYGNTDNEIETEDVLPKTTEPYACSKVAGEYILRGIPKLDYVIIRIGTTYGEGMRPALFNFIALDSVKNGREILVNGNGLQTRNYIYIDDLAEGFLRAVMVPVPNGEIINLCGKASISVLDTIKIAEEIVGKRAIYKFFMSGRYGEIYHEHISIDKAKKLLDGWEPKTGYYSGMEKTYKYDARLNG